MLERTENKKRIIRNIIVFIIIALSSGWVGYAVDNILQSFGFHLGLGILLWLLIPMGAGLLLRDLSGDGWRDAGLQPHFKKGWVSYLLAIFILPIVALVLFLVALGFGVMDVAQFSDIGLPEFVSMIAFYFAYLFLKNIFEESAWRGYLTPRFEELGLHPLINHTLTGFFWGLWHLPYWFFFTDVLPFTTLSTPVFIVFWIFTMMMIAITYGELRLLSGSIWPTVIMHALANAISVTLILNGFTAAHGGLGAPFAFGSDGIVHATLFMVVGMLIYCYRRGDVAK